MSVPVIYPSVEMRRAVRAALERENAYVVVEVGAYERLIEVVTWVEDVADTATGSGISDARRYQARQLIAGLGGRR